MYKVSRKLSENCRTISDFILFSEDGHTNRQTDRRTPETSLSITSLRPVELQL